MYRILLTLSFLFLALTARAGTVLIEDVRIFNGVDASLAQGNILVVDLSLIHI